jgi:hypothetical protein
MSAPLLDCTGMSAAQLQWRPRIEAARDCKGFYVLRGSHGWLCGDRRQALTEFAGLVDIERWGSTT